MSNLSGILDELGELDQSNIGSWPVWAYACALILVVALIAGVGTWYFILPQVEILEQKQAQEETLKQTFTKKHKQVASLDKYIAQVARMHEQFSQMLDQLPSRSEIPDLLHDISNIRQSSGLVEEIFKPQKPITRDFYVVFPNTMTVTGKFHDLADFVSRIAQLPRIVTIKDVLIKPTDEGGEDDRLRMSMTINTYRYDEDADDGK